MFATELPGLGFRGGSSDRLAYADIDDAKEELARLELEIATLRSRQVRILAWLDSRRVARVERSRSMEEWTAAALDVAPSTARDLVTTARSHTPADEVDRDLETGSISFDRAVATQQLRAAGGTDRDLDESRDHDVVGVRRRVAALKRVTRVDEREVMRRRHLTIVPTLGDSAWKISGIAPGYVGHIIAKALEERADEFPTGPDGDGESRGARRLDALTALSQDYLDGGDGADCCLHDPIDETSEPAGAGEACPGRGGARPGKGGSAVTVFLDAAAVDTASRQGFVSGGEFGGTIAAGPRIGPDTLERILCTGTVCLVTLDHGRTPVDTTPRTRQIPPAIRDFVLQRDGGCVMAGCRSRYRLEPHHIRRYADAGTHHPDNLATLCWFHHHVSVHGYGHRLDPASPPHRRRFLRPGEQRIAEKEDFERWMRSAMETDDPPTTVDGEGHGPAPP